MSDNLFKNNLRNTYNKDKNFKKNKFSSNTISTFDEDNDDYFSKGLKNQIFKVLKLRLFIQNIKIPEEELISLISENLKLINIQKLKASTINIFIDDLVDIVKKDYTKNDNSFKEGEEEITKTEENSHKLTPSNILNFHKKLYTNNLESKKLNKKNEKIFIQPPMKFNLEKNKIYTIDYNEHLKNYDNFDNEIEDIESIEERIIREISGKNKRNIIEDES